MTDRLLPVRKLKPEVPAINSETLPVSPAIEALLKNAIIPDGDRAFVEAAVRLFLHPEAHPAKDWNPPKGASVAKLKELLRRRVNADLKRLGFANKYQLDFFKLPGSSSPVAGLKPRRSARRAGKG